MSLESEWIGAENNNFENEKPEGVVPESSELTRPLKAGFISA